MVRRVNPKRGAGRLVCPDLAGQAAWAEQAFLAGTAGLLDERALAWYRAGALLRLASKAQEVKRQRPGWRARADALLEEAARLAEAAG